MTLLQHVGLIIILLILEDKQIMIFRSQLERKVPHNTILTQYKSLEWFLCADTLIIKLIVIIYIQLYYLVIKKQSYVNGKYIKCFILRWCLALTCT